MRIESLNLLGTPEYLLNSEHYVKTAAHQWLLTEYDDPEVILSFSAFEFQVQIADLYESIQFADANTVTEQ